MTQKTGVVNVEWDMIGRHYIIRVSPGFMEHFIEAIQKGMGESDTKVEFQLMQQEWVEKSLEDHLKWRLSQE